MDRGRRIPEQNGETSALTRQLEDVCVDDTKDEASGPTRAGSLPAGGDA